MTETYPEVKRLNPAAKDVKEADCLLVLGMHRSGLSALAGAFCQTDINVAASLLAIATAEQPQGYREGCRNFLHSFAAKPAPYSDREPLPQLDCGSTAQGDH